MRLNKENLHLEDEDELELLFEQKLVKKPLNVNVPEELEGRLKSVIRDTANRERNRHRLTVLRTIAAVASLLLIVSIILLSPTLSAYAKEWLGVRVPSEWMKLFQSYSGIKNAQEHDYRPVPPVTVEKDGITVTIENIYLEESKLSFYAAIKGAYERQIGFLIMSADFPGAGMSSSNTSLKDDGGEMIDVVNVSQSLDEKEVVEFLNGNPNHLTFKVIQTPSQHREEQHFMNVEVLFDASMVVRDKKIKIDKKLIVEDAISVAVDTLAVSPSEMKLQYRVQAADGKAVLLHNRSGDVHPYFTDPVGNVYASSDTHMRRVDPKAPNVISFYPSAYFQQGTELVLHIDKVWVTDLNDKKSFDIRLNEPENYPQIVQFRDQTITVLGAKYEEGHLYLDVKKDQEQRNELLPWKIDFDNYYDKMNRDPDLFRLYQEKYKVYSYEGYGRSYPKMDANGKEVPDMYQVMIMAPEQESYRLDIYRYEDPIEMNQTITVPVP